MRDAISIQNPVDMADRMWLTANSATIPHISRFDSTPETIIIKGREVRATTQAYMVIMSPARDSVIEKSAAISLSSPMGMNSEVLKIKVENVRAKSGNHSLTALLLLIVIFCIKSLLKKSRKYSNFAGYCKSSEILTI